MAQLSKPGIGGARTSKPTAFQVRTFGSRKISAQRVASAPGPLITLVVGLACVVLGLSVSWAGDVSETAAGFWPQAGLAIVALLAVPRRRWGWVVVGLLFPSFVGLAFGLMPVAAAVWWALANCVEPLFAVITLRWVATHGYRTYNRGLIRFFVVAVVLAPMLGAAIGSIGTMVAYDESWLSVWRQWVLGDALGVLIVASLLLEYRPSKPTKRSRYEIVGLITALAVSVGLTFINSGANGAALLPYVILVSMIWAGMRFGARAAAAAGYVTALGVNIATSLGYGPFAASQRSADVVTLQIFLIIAVLTGLIIASMAHELTDRVEVSRLLAHQAKHDALTGLLNRNVFVDRLDEALAADRRDAESTVAVFVVDLDDFKRFNDRHGHPVGDQVLCTAAELLAQQIAPDGVLARLGGDAFVVLVTDVGDAELVKAAATRLVLGFAPGVLVGGNTYPLSASVGVACIRGNDPITGADLMHRADLALFHAKRTPGLSMAMFDDSLEADSRRRVEIGEELRDSIERGEMAVFYQPIISIESGQLIEYEALLRWNNRRFGAVGPAEFIPVAEDNGFIDLLGDWVLAAACKQLGVWRSKSLNEGLRVSVNVSARQLSDTNFPDRVRKILAAALSPASALTLEITETAMMYNTDASDLVLRDLREMGIRFAMDDFGTGFSSMSTLRRCPMDVLKIDRSFVAGVGKITKDTAICASIIDLGHSFGLDVVAEGVETFEQREHLARLGCDRGQGFYWSQAVDAAAATAMLRHNLHMPPANLIEDVALVSSERTQVLARAMADDSPVATMLRGLLRIRSADQAALLLQNAAVAFGGVLTSPAQASPNALPLDLSLGDGTPVFVEADPMSVARLQLERFMPKLTEDAREAVDLLRRNDRLKDASNTDPLTGLANRWVLDRVLPRTTHGAVVVIDLDHFKAINDTEGHHAGDAVLADFGQMLRNEARASDVCCRFGGEEFVIIASGTTVAEAVDLTGRLRDAWVHVRHQPVTFSAGVAAIGFGIAGGRDALAGADRALYRAKELGRDRTESELVVSASISQP